MEPAYNKMMQERMAEEAERQRQEETPAERSARTAYESAQSHLEKVKTSTRTDATGRSYNPYTWEDRRQAEEDVKTNPIDQFSQWWNEAVTSQIDEVNAMTLATATPAKFRRPAS